MNNKFTIEDHGQLQVRIFPHDNREAVMAIAETVKEMQRWCQLNRGGKRMSFDVFRFKNAKQRTMFMLRWYS